MFRFIVSFLLIVTPSLSLAETIPSSLTSEDSAVGIVTDLNQLSAEELAELQLYDAPSIFTGSGDIPEPPPEAVECFADGRYRFGSVSADPTLGISGTVASVPLVFKVSMENNNPYPIVDAAVYMKIFRVNPDDAVRHQHGDNLVAQFFAKEGIALNAYATTSFEVTWNTPAYLRSGEYRAVTYVTTAHRYNLLGLSFTDDVTGNQTNFTISEGVDTNIEWDKSTVEVNGDYYAFAAFTPKLDATNPILIAPELVNTTTQSEPVVITWKLYYWDAQRTEQLIDTKTETVLVNAGESLRVPYTITDTNYSVYYLVAEAKWRDTDSIIGVRVTRDGVDFPRINFPSITKYPLTANEPVELFSCLHNGGTNHVVPGHSLILTLKDKKGDILHSFTYNGDITGAMMAVADTYTPTADHDVFSLIATLKKGDTVVDETVTTYDCATLGVPCPQPIVVNNETDNNQTAILILILLTTLIVFGFVWFKRQHTTDLTTDDDDSNSSSSPIAPLSLLLLIMVGMGMGVPGEVEGKSVTATVGNLPKLDYLVNVPKYTSDNVTLSTDTSQCQGQYFSNSYGYIQGQCGWIAGLAYGSYAQVTHKARIINHDTGVVISEGSVIPVGTRIRVEQIPRQDTDIVWFGTGYASDSPYGHWVAGAGPLPYACRAHDYVNRAQVYAYINGNWVSWNSSFDVYILFNVNPVSGVPVGVSGNLSCTGNVYTVTEAGSVSLRMNFAGTYGRFYHRYYAHNSAFGTGCFASNVPMRLSLNPYGYYSSCQGRDCNPNPPYTVYIPAQTIPFTLTAVSLSEPPSPPTVTHIAPLDPALNQGYVGINQTFTIGGSIDPEGDNIKYQIDWGSDGSIDGCYPTNCSSLIPSGSSGNVTRLWNASGNKSFRVRAVDSNGSASGWTNSSINIITPNSKLIICPGDSITLAINQSTNLSTYYWFDYTNAGNPDCTTTGGQLVTDSTNWVANNGPSVVVAENASPNKGRVTGITAGNTVIIASYNGSTATKPIIVINNPSLTLTATDCDLPLNESLDTATCDIGLNWNILYSTEPYVLKYDNTNTTLNATAPASGSLSDPRGLGTHDYTLTEDSGVSRSASAEANCPAGSIVHVESNECRIPPVAPVITIAATPDLVRRGNTTELNISINSQGEDLTCTLYGATSDSPKAFTYTGSTNTFNSIIVPVTTKPLMAKQNVLVRCHVTDFSVVTGEASTIIEVVPSMQEI